MRTRGAEAGLPSRAASMEPSFDDDGCLEPLALVDPQGLLLQWSRRSMTTDAGRRKGDRRGEGSASMEPSFDDDGCNASEMDDAVAKEKLQWSRRSMTT